MSFLYQFLANSIAIIHLMVAAYLLSLIVVIFMKRIPTWYIMLQSFILGIAGIFHFTSGVCPLTFGENYFRKLSGANTYEGNFLNHYAEEIFHFSIPNKLVSNSIIVLAILFVYIVTAKLKTRQKLVSSN